MKKKQLSSSLRAFLLYPIEAEMEGDVSPPGQELTVNHTWVHRDTMSSDSRSLQEDSGSSPDQPAHAEWSGCMDEELAELAEGKGQSRDLGEMSWVWAHNCLLFATHWLTFACWGIFSLSLLFLVCPGLGATAAYPPFFAEIFFLWLL